MKRVLLSLVAVVLALSVSAQEVQWGVKSGVNLSTYSVGLATISTKLKSGVNTGFYIGGVNNLQLSKNGKWSLQSEVLFNIGGASTKVNDSLFSSLSDLGFDLSQVTDEIDLDENLRISYKTYNFQIPIMARFKTSEGLSIMAGPYINARVGGRFKLNDAMIDVLDSEIQNADGAYMKHFMSMLPLDEYVDVSDSSTYRDGIIEYLGDVANSITRSIDFGLSMGIEYSFKSGIFFEGRYNMGLLNLARRSIDSDLLNYNYDEEMSDIDLGVKLSSRTQFIQIGVGYRF